MSSHSRFCVTLIRMLICGAVMLQMSVSVFASEERARAKTHFNNALTLLETERFEEAAKELELSIDLYPSKAGIYNLANCYRALGVNEKALDLFRRLLTEYDEKLSAETRQDIEKQIGELEVIVASSSPPPSLPTTTPDLSVTDDSVGSSPAASTAPHRTRAVLFWSGIAGTVIFTGLSAAFWGITLSKKRDFNSDVSAFNDNVDDAYWDLSDADELSVAESERSTLAAERSTIMRFNRAAVGMTIAAGAFAAFTVTTLFLPKSERTTSAMSVSATPGGVIIGF